MSDINFDLDDFSGICERAEEVYRLLEPDFLHGTFGTYPQSAWAFDLMQLKLRAQFLTAARSICESPIEQIMLAALNLTPFFREDINLIICQETKWHQDDSVLNTITPQCEVGGYRLDFQLSISSQIGGITEKLLIAIECDGHDFHEKTKEQAARDKFRDRDLQMLGWRVFRFTGSEIFQNAWWCAEQLADFADSYFGDRDSKFWDSELGRKIRESQRCGDRRISV